MSQSLGQVPHSRSEHSILEFRLRVPAQQCPRARLHRRAPLHIRRAGEDEGSDSTESLFSKELKRRAAEKEGAQGPFDGPSTSGQQQQQTQRRRKLPDAPRFQGEAVGGGGQLERSRALNSEGLEGLIPRASKLAQLGVSFWLGLWPIVLGLFAIAGVLYGVYGSNLVHGGHQPMRMPSYVDPQDILYQPNSEPMVPYYFEQRQ